jgi:hypothetical protein
MPGHVTVQPPAKRSGDPRKTVRAYRKGLTMKEFTMSKRIRLGIAVFASLSMPGLTSGLQAEERCSNASLKGSYAFRVDGTNISNPYLPLGPFAAVGENIYDGKGNMRGTITISANGMIIPTTYAGTYTVGANCTGVKSAALKIGAVVDFSFVIDDNLRGIQMVLTQAGPPDNLAQGLTVSGGARKIFADVEDR